MPDINDLNLADEAVGEVDYDAPESGSFPPTLKPGEYEFVFKLEDDPYDTTKVEGRDYLQINHKAGYEHDGQDRELRFQRASFYKSEKMPNSRAGDLFRSLDVRINGPLTRSAVRDALAEVDGRARFWAEVGWRRYCKTCDIEVSTNPSKKKVRDGKQVAWPRDGQGEFEELVACPKCGAKGYGREEITRYKLPKAS